MFPYVFGASGVVKNQGDVEGVGIGMFDDDVPVDGDSWVVVFDESIELVNATKSVFVGGVAVKKFVLDEAVEGAEFGEVAPKDSTSMHQAQGAGNLSFAFENLPERFAVFASDPEGAINEVPAFFDELAKGRRRRDLIFLTVDEEADEAIGVFFKNVFSAC